VILRIYAARADDNDSTCHAHSGQAAGGGTSIVLDLIVCLSRRLGPMLLLIAGFTGCCHCGPMCCDECQCPGWSQPLRDQPPCFGYHSTCWHAWPPECIACPPFTTADLPLVISDDTLAPEPIIDPSLAPLPAPLETPLPMPLPPQPLPEPEPEQPGER
jgi:hypothetical protein